jgi:acyl-CoA dehydrogenase
MMDLSFSAEERGFEKEVREFIAENLTPEMKRAQALTPSVFSDPDIGIAWQKSLHKKGWGAPGWPVEYGGPDWTAAQRWIFEAECARAGAPNVNVMGVKMVGPVIIGFGNSEQKNYYLPRILSGEDYWCQGYSEPGSGSDLASLKTRAVRDGDDYIINGTKIWTTHAHHANRMFALVRTNDAPRQQDGISFILIEMKSPGITIRPILTIGGDHEVNQVFFDDVRVPIANRVGEEGKGWTYGKYLLEFERGAGIASAKLRDALRTVSDLANSDATGRAIEDPDVAVRMSEIEVDIDTLEITELRVLSALQTGQNPGAVSSLLKLRVSEIRQAVTRLGVEVIGNDGLAVEPMRPFYKLNQEPAIPEAMLPIVPEYLNGRAYTIFGGSSEIQRDIVAKMVLGL